LNISASRGKDWPKSGDWPKQQPAPVQRASPKDDLMRRMFLTTALILSGFPVLADDLALLLGTERYEVLGRMAGAADIVEATPGLAALGFKVTSLPNGRADTIAGALAGFLAAEPGIGATPDRIIVALSGRFVTDGGRTWFLSADATPPGLMTLGTTALSVESILQILGRAPGRATLLLGVDPDQSTVFDPWLHEGVGRMTAPQGVSILRGTPADVAAFMTDDMTTAGGDLAKLVGDNGTLTVQGFLPAGLIFMPDAPAQVPVIVPPVVVDSPAETALWDGAVALDTVPAYRDYLRRYPMGRFAGQAETAIAAILAEPHRADRLAEDGLTLTRDQRRNIQRNLSLLDFNPRGIDGIFGPGTRGAITNWQQENGFPQTSYLTTEQINRIEAQAARRAAQIEAAAEQQRQQQDRLDRAFWDETGASGDEAGYRAYLERFPDGLFAEDAADQLALIEDSKRREAEAEDRAAWDRVRAADRVQGYQNYLRAYPDGVFKAEAQARIAALTQAQTEEGANADAAALEQALNLNALAARLVEVRLDQLGLNPGEVDGQFDGATRRALRRYQRERDLPVSGYLNEPTVVRLLADSLPQ
jgi:peptidoglycan hydrolase-like protein with peptidoglycan-binding domain